MEGDGGEGVEEERAEKERAPARRRKTNLRSFAADEDQLSRTVTSTLAAPSSRTAARGASPEVGSLTGD